VCFNTRINPPHIVEVKADGDKAMIHESEQVELRARCAPALHKMIKDAATESARSLSAEITHRLKRSFGGEADRELKSSS
jgi:hypothetical protein